MRNETFASVFCGFLFALGLGISGMTQPQKVVGFLDVMGNWDPSLLFVMVGAILVYAIGFRQVLKKSKPLLSSAFFVPNTKQLDGSLLLGAAIFGVGWGLAGFCPGPALTSLVSFQRAPWIFALSMLGSMALFEWFQKRGAKS